MFINDIKTVLELSKGSNKIIWVVINFVNVASGMEWSFPILFIEKEEKGIMQKVVLPYCNIMICDVLMRCP
jgi:hypothetical protein